jgi:aspartate carbamoyltransferase catalytic subunit
VDLTLSQGLFALQSLSLTEIQSILRRAQEFCDGVPMPDYSSKLACNLFFEPSTRTSYSFQVAQNRLKMRSLIFSSEHSSLQKGESFYDTIKVFDCFNPDLLIVRHGKEKFYEEFAGSIDTPVINAGDGAGSHPTQSLIDLITIKQEFGYLAGLNVAIVGDVLHSRVANTNIEIMQRFGMKVFMSGPPEFLKRGMSFFPLLELIEFCDVIVMLRVQNERHDSKFSLKDYNFKYGLNSKMLSLMKPGAIIMHPGPVNRGIELTEDLVECSRSRIFNQVKNGICVRASVMEAIFKSLI